MIILGVSCFSHDTSACLIADGQIVAMTEEERFSRIKHDTGFPHHAIQFVLDEGNQRSEEIDIVALPYEFFIGLGRRFAYGLKNLRKAPSFLLLNLGNELATYMGFEAKIRGNFERSGIPLKKSCRIICYEHHLAHIASGYLASPYDDAMLISWDGRGEWPCVMLAHGHGLDIDVIDRSYFPNSVGQVYQAVTQFMGFSDIGDEYKVMGLAAYGKPVYKDSFQRFLKTEGTRISVSQKYMNYHIYNRHMADRYTMKLEKEVGKPRRLGEPMEQRHMDIAASIQAHVSDIGVDIANKLQKKNGCKNLCLAGGVAQNIMMNQAIYERTDFENIFVQPASHDAGLALGAALLAARDNGDMKERFVMETAAWGKSYSTDEIRTELENYGLGYAPLDNAPETTARMIADGKVVGWFNGRTEFGARALGNRSILADARNPDMKDIVNRKIKFRESFRPFAPSILAERALEYFEGSPVNPFMTFYARVTSQHANDVKAITHVDGSARPQAVYKESNRKYWEMIKCVEKHTGAPMVMNTSFNIKGEPIVNSPSDALRTFFTTGLDFLVIEDLVVYKTDFEDVKQYLND